MNIKPNNYFEAAGTVAASGDGTVFGTVAANQCRAFFEMQVQLEGTGPQTFIFKGGSVSPRLYCANAGDGMIKTYGFDVDDKGLWSTLPGSAFVINSSGSALYNYYVRGFTYTEY